MSNGGESAMPSTNHGCACRSAARIGKNDSVKLQINPKILVDAHLFVEFEKYCEIEQVAEKINLYPKHETTDFQT